jgi:hypothetical protein
LLGIKTDKDYIPCASKPSSNINTYDVVATDTSLDQSSRKDDTVDTSTSNKVFDVGTVFKRRILNPRVVVIYPRVLEKGLKMLGTKFDVLAKARGV